VEKTFELMKAYAELGLQERKIIEYLYELEIFEGDYSQLAREVNLDISNLRKTLKYLDSLSIVFIKTEKYLDEVKLKTNRNGKTYTTYNKMEYCFLVEGWTDILVNQYRYGNIFHDDKSKRMFVNETIKMLSEEVELELLYEE
jgi:predicted transcriptional regulator with HTH domain